MLVFVFGLGFLYVPLTPRLEFTMMSYCVGEADDTDSRVYGTVPVLYRSFASAPYPIVLHPLIAPGLVLPLPAGLLSRSIPRFYAHVLRPCDHSYYTSSPGSVVTPCSRCRQA
jgi:hypothetical protein